MHWKSSFKTGLDLSREINNISFDKNWFSRFKSEITSFWIWTHVLDNLRHAEQTVFHCNMLYGKGVYKQIENTVDAYNKMKSHNYKCMSRLLRIKNKG